MTPEYRPGRPARNDYQRALLQLPEQSWMTDQLFPTDDELNEVFRSTGYSEAAFPYLRDRYHRSYNQIFAQKGVCIIGNKPTGGQGFYRVQIPKRDIMVRVWDGGLLHYGQYFMDLIDAKGNAVNLPDGCQLYSGHPGPEEQMVSWENSFGVAAKDIKPGEERFIVVPGFHYCVRMLNYEDFWFTIPTTPPPPPITLGSASTSASTSASMTLHVPQ